MTALKSICYKVFILGYNFRGFQGPEGVITELSCSSDSCWLQRAYNLVLFTQKDQPDSLSQGSLTKLSLSLVRAQMPVPASTILRVMLEKVNLPPMAIFGMVILHMVKTYIGTCLAYNSLVEICDHFDRLSAKNALLEC